MFQPGQFLSVQSVEAHLKYTPVQYVYFGQSVSHRKQGRINTTVGDLIASHSTRVIKGDSTFANARTFGSGLQNEQALVACQNLTSEISQSVRQSVSQSVSQSVRHQAF